MKRGAICSLVLLFAGIVFVGFAHADLNDGLVAYYPFDGDANDMSGNGNNTTIHNASFVGGKIGNGLQFAGNFDSYIEAPSSPSLNPSEAISISLWAKVHDFSKWHSCLIYKAGQEPTSSGFRDRVYTLWMTSDLGVAIGSTPEGSSRQIWCETDKDLYQKDEFVHLVGIVNPLNHTIDTYVNGALIDSCPYQGDMIRGGDYPLRIGAPFKTLSDQSAFNGIIDEVRIYNRALSGSEIQQLYNEGNETNNDECSVDIKGYSLSGYLQTGRPLTITVDAKARCSNTVYYRFSFHPDYGTSGYDGNHWTQMTSSEYKTGNQCDFTFSGAGKYIIVVWAVTDTLNINSNGVPITGFSVNITDDGPYFPFQ